MLGHGGVQKTIEVPLDETEKELLRKSIEEIRSNIRTVEEGMPVIPDDRPISCSFEVRIIP